MAKDEVGVIRQYDFHHGPNYTDSIYSLKDQEIADSENLYWEGTLKTIPGAGRVVSTTIAGTSHNFTGLYQYIKSDKTRHLIAATDQGRVFYSTGSTWTSLATGLSTSAEAHWHWIVFNNTLIGTSEKNVPKKWGGVGGTFATLGGSPPMAHFSVQHAVDFMFFAGHTSNPSQLRYNDTATTETWPVGNTLEIGRNDGQIITGLQKFGDSTAVFKNSSIWLVSGNSPNDFQINPTPSDVGCIAPHSIVLTDAGIFFWSEAGPAIFNGFKSTLLGKRLRRILDEDVDWTAAHKIWSSYYPNKKQVLTSYQRIGQSQPDRMLLLDLYRLSNDPDPETAFWPITVGEVQAMTNGYETATDVRKIFLGHSSGHVTVFDSGSTTFNTATITPRMRTGALHLGKPDKVQLVRDITVRSKAQTGRIAIRYAMDGAQTFTTHASTPYSTAKASYDVHQKMFEGDGSGRYMQGNILQLDFLAVGSTGYELHGFEVGTETTSRREIGA